MPASVSREQWFEAAKTGDLAQIKAAFGGAAQTCKSCHDSYRKD